MATVLPKLRWVSATWRAAARSFQTERTRPLKTVRKRDSRQPVKFQIGESRLGTPRADRKFNVTVDGLSKPPNQSNAHLGGERAAEVLCLYAALYI